ncbi:LOW QUALITY PROTEIN: hypothetical protein T265_12459 [Opisthorchis viverrini]|uniref:Uncharacterized protein n=1 Tax=Opisthorchis viverrini TaxID=6198 RepID=A0A075A3P0_OPIVI|nr:LOW QUALITY PROTEIN: hypothetical protein T265_12459 [Opisthorchis viverrini]KER34288.1 LOW QUALITY PROTEIN: hypothetical protein T265_12459 [Opisthorchis viverrini]
MASEAAFVEKFVGVSFPSSTAFGKISNEYMKDNFVIFVLIEAPTIFCITNGCTTNAAGALQDQRKAVESEEASKPSSGMVHFGNVTNNRLENTNGRLNDRVHHSDTLSVRCLLMTSYALHDFNGQMNAPHEEENAPHTKTYVNFKTTNISQNFNTSILNLFSVTDGCIKSWCLSFTDSRIDTQDRGYCPSLPGRFCSCRSVAVVHLKGTSLLRIDCASFAGVIFPENDPQIISLISIRCLSTRDAVAVFIAASESCMTFFSAMGPGMDIARYWFSEESSLSTFAQVAAFLAPESSSAFERRSNFASSIPIKAEHWQWSFGICTGDWVPFRGTLLFAALDLTRFEVDIQDYRVTFLSRKKEDKADNHQLSWGVIIIIIDSMTSVFNTDASLPYNHDLFESLIVKKRVKCWTYKERVINGVGREGRKSMWKRKKRGVSSSLFSHTCPAVCSNFSFPFTYVFLPLDSKSIFKLRRSVCLVLMSILQRGKRVVPATTLDSFGNNVCCVLGTRIQDASTVIELTAISLQSLLAALF